MTTIFSDVKKLSCLEKEPYIAFAKKYKSLKGNIDFTEIELSIGNGKEGFYKGFYSDDDYMVTPKIKFMFKSDVLNNDGATGILVRMVYTFECNDCNFSYYRRRIKLLKARAPYLYVAGVTHFEITSHVDEEFELIFDAIITEKAEVEKTCYSLLSMIIAILPFED